MMRSRSDRDRMLKRARPARAGFEPLRPGGFPLQYYTLPKGSQPRGYDPVRDALTYAREIGIEPGCRFHVTLVRGDGRRVRPWRPADRVIVSAVRHGRQS